MPTRLLIVDDHEVVRLGVRTLFAENDALAVCGEAQNGLEAIRMVSETSPDVVILDLSMRGMNGFETAARIRQLAPSTRIVFFSFHEIPIAARLAGADAFVSKCSPLQELAFTVNRVMHPTRLEGDDVTVTSREKQLSEPEIKERRQQPRANLSQVVRVRPFDASLPPDDCTTFNVSRGGLYCATSKDHYAPGMNVYVTSDFRPDNPEGHTVAGVVVRVENLEAAKWGVAIHIFSPLSSTSVETMTS
jgi:DNA-binding NarL/FixJ family response regulator